MTSYASATWWSPDASLIGKEAADRVRHALNHSPICLVPRRIDAAILEVLDRSEPSFLPKFDLLGPPTSLHALIRASPIAGDETTAHAMSWLRDDVLNLIELYAAVTEADGIQVRLHLTRDGDHRRFGIDHHSTCFVTTYRGPGTEWLDPLTSRTAFEDAAWVPTEAHAIGRGTLAFMCGGASGPPGRPTIVHRVSRTGSERRLFLMLNNAGYATT